MPQTNPGEPFARITVDEAKAMIESGEARVVDVREPNEWATGHIESAELIPLNGLLRDQSKIRGGTNIIFVCEAGQRSAVAADMAAVSDVTGIYSMEGGMSAWRGKGFPTAR